MKFIYTTVLSITIYIIWEKNCTKNNLFKKLYIFFEISKNRKILVLLTYNYETKNGRPNMYITFFIGITM